MQYTAEQLSVIDSLVSHCYSSENFMVLEAKAGTGKTTCLKRLLQLLPDKRVAVVASTNKAVKVINSMLPKADAMTIYSLLKLRVSEDGEIKTIVGYNSTVQINNVDVVIVDEAGMLGKKMMAYLEKTSRLHPHIRWIFMGDRWQLPPVREATSLVWSIENRVTLSKVMRNSSHILKLANHVRDLLESPARLDLCTGKGVTRVNDGFAQTIYDKADGFRNGSVKALAWRNATVDQLNLRIRKTLLANPEHGLWQVGERVTVTEPVRGTDNSTIAATDEEGSIKEITTVKHPVFTTFDAYRLDVKLDSGVIAEMFVPTDKSMEKYQKRLQDLSKRAKTHEGTWGDFWVFSNAFAKVRHAYATTVHRSQGSTYETAIVNWKDIVSNPKRQEALQCLYVAISRPSKELILN